MNGNDRLERELTTWFADTATPRTPDWTADILTATATMRQRPRWSFPARWLPAAVVPRLPRLTLRPVPWRTIALLALLGLLLAAAVTLYVGSRPRLPAPFGPAVNGLVAYFENGNIWTVDPVTGERKAIVSLPGDDVAPRWSRDGTRIAFLRAAAGGQSLTITNADGSGMVVVRQPGVRAGGHGFHLLVAKRRVGRRRGETRTAADDIPRRYDDRRGRDLETPGVDTEVYWRPPDGRQLEYIRNTAAGRQPMLVPAEVGAGHRHARPGSRPPAGWLDAGWEVLRPPSFRRQAERAWTELLDPETGKVIPLEVAFGRVSNDGKQVVGHRMSLANEILCAMPLSGGACDPIADPRSSRPNSTTLPGCSGRLTTAGSSRTHRTKTSAGCFSTPRADRRSGRSGRSAASNRGNARRRDGAGQANLPMKYLRNRR